MIEREVDVPTRDGAMNTFVVHPERGGPHPVVLFPMDAPGRREAERHWERLLALFDRNLPSLRPARSRRWYASGVRGAVATCSVESPIGRLRLAATAKGVARIDFPRGSDFEGWLSRTLGDASRASHAPLLDKLVQQLEEYFAGRRREFDLPLDLYGTPFQCSVWCAIAEIPFGETRSYGDVARRIRRPRAVRAVGAATGANPVPIVIPCHRVITSEGRLGGFGGGLPTKRALLAHEQTKAFTLG